MANKKKPKSKFRWKKFPKIGCRCVRSSDKMVKSTKCKTLRSPCAKKRRKKAASASEAASVPTAPPVEYTSLAPDIEAPPVEYTSLAPDIEVPGWAPISPQALGYFRPSRRRR